MSDPNKMLTGLINGVIRLDYYSDNTITEDLLKQELYPDDSSDSFVALLHKIRSLIKGIDVVKFEVDEKRIGHVLQSLKDIEEQIDAHSGRITS